LALNESYEYDNGANAKGKLTKITDASGSMAFAYDINGTLAKKTQTIANQQFITSYSYDEHDRMTSQTYPSGKVIGYSYDSKGELVSMSIDGVPFISNIETNDNGLQGYEYADGTKHTREYDSNGRVTQFNYPNYTEEVNYNVVSNIINIKSDAINRAFGYDNLDRLTSYEQNATDFQNFVYDGNGNRLNQDQENNETKVFTYAQNSNILNSIAESNSTDTTNISYEYDATGNIIKDDKHVYTYDSRNRLTAIDSNVTYQYNYDNKRVSKTVNGVKTYFVYDGHMLIGEYQLNLSDDSRQEYVYLNSTPIATLNPQENYRIYADHLDTSRRVASNNEESNIVWKWESKPFGETEASGEITFNLRFPGQYFDSETKTHYNINRDYNPVTGRYIQSDPIGFDGGVNGFGYVEGNPLIGFDLLGLLSRKTIIKDYYYGAGWSLNLNYSANGSKPWNEFHTQSTVNDYGTAISIAAGRYAINPNLIKAIMYMETTHGWYDTPLSWFNANKSILPMNINIAYWGNTFGSRAILEDPEKNIMQGAKMIHRIQINMREPYSIRQFATLYNNINATKVNDYGARVENIYYEQTWNE
jgi:RHS repeat-associated protein